MHEVEDREAEQIANAFRPSRTPLRIAAAANVVLAAAFLGVPYLRGQRVANAARATFADAAACLFDAQPATGGGLGLPVGDAERYAGLVMRGPSDWPARCMRDLNRVAPEEATFLWPSVKQASADVRATVALTVRELEAVVALRTAGSGRVPVRPMLALSKLRAALTLLAQAAGDTEHLDDNAVRFVTDGLAAAPTRLPISAGPDALLEVWGSPDGVEATALDARGLSWLRLEGGKLDRFRLKISSLVRATLRIGTQSLVLWAMPPEVCAEREDRCSKRASGVARLPMGAETLPEPTWLGGHPAGRADRALGTAHDGAEVALVALDGPSGEVQLRSFALPQAALDDRPLAPERRSPTTPPTLDAVMLDARTGSFAYLMQSDGVLRGVVSQNHGTHEAALGEVPGETGWLGACHAETAQWVVLGGSSEVRVTRVGDGPLRTSAPLSLRVRAPFHPDRPTQDRVKLRCDDERVELLVLDDTARLQHARCNAQADCSAPNLLAQAVQRFDALVIAEGLLVAHTGSGAAADVRTTRVTPAGVEATVHTAPCWDPTGGFCGQPVLVADGARILLIAREGGDLLVVESADAGQNWHAAASLQVHGANTSSNSAPMDQHRIRKGLK